MPPFQFDGRPLILHQTLFSTSRVADHTFHFALFIETDLFAASGRTTRHRTFCTGSHPTSSGSPEPNTISPRWMVHQVLFNVRCQPRTRKRLLPRRYRLATQPSIPTKMVQSTSLCPRPSPIARSLPHRPWLPNHPASHHHHRRHRRPRTALPAWTPRYLLSIAKSKSVGRRHWPKLLPPPEMTAVMRPPDQSPIRTAKIMPTVGIPP